MTLAFVVAMAVVIVMAAVDASVAVVGLVPWFLSCLWRPLGWPCPRRWMWSFGGSNMLVAAIS